MKINKWCLIRILEEAKIGSPSGSSNYSRNYFLFKIPMVVQESYRRDAGGEISTEELESLVRFCVENGYVDIPPEGSDNIMNKPIRLTKRGSEKLRSLQTSIDSD